MNIKLKILFLLLASAFVNAQQFNAPVIRGDFADPTVIRVGDVYYATGTSSEWAPHYPIFESGDLIHWHYVGAAFQTKPEWTKASFWAPEFYLLNGKIYLYYTARRASDGVSYIGVAVTDDIKKGFEDKGCLVAFGREAIDAFVFEDGGKHYITWKAYGLDDRPIELLCSELSPDGLQLVGEPFTLLKDEDNIGLEGQYIFKKEGYYYIIYSIRGCCGAGSNYAVSVARSRSLRGVYEHYKGNPVLQGDGRDILSCGHGTAVEAADGKTYYLFHAYRKGSGFYNGRQAYLKELTLNDEKWPCFVDAGDVKPADVQDFADTFDGAGIRPEWTWNFVYSDVRTKTAGKTLFLTGAVKDNNKYGSALCLRTLMPDYEMEAEIKEPQNNVFAGLTLYGDKDNLVVFGKENGNLILKQIKKGEEQILYKETVAGDIHLKIKISEGCIASFSRSLSRTNKTWQSLPVSCQQLNVSYLPPWDRAFRPGLIHIGNENIPAEFTYCKLSYLK